MKILPIGKSRTIELWLLWLLPVLLPTFMIRFSFFHLPSTILELYLFFVFFAFTFSHGIRGWADGWKRLGVWKAPILAWVAASFVAVFAAPAWLAGLGLWRAYVLEPILVLIVAAAVLQTEKERAYLYRGFIASAVLVTAWAVIQFMTGYGIPHPWNVTIAAGRRATSFLRYPNALSLFLGPIGAYAFVRWLSSKKDWWSLVGWIVAFIGICLAKSDGGLLAFGFVAFVALLLKQKTRWWAIGVGLLGVMVVFFISLLRQTVIATMTFSEWSGQVRLFQWRETWQMIHDHWFFGAGFGGYPTVFAPYHLAKAIEIFQYPHNILLNVWSETGILGVIAFGWIVIMWVRQIFHASSDVNERALMTRFASFAPLLAILIHGLVDVPYFKNDLAIAFWLIAFIAVIGKEKVMS